MHRKEVFFSIFVIALFIAAIGFIMADDAGTLSITILPRVLTPANFSITINSSTGDAILNWSEVPNVDGYKIWYSSNVTEILQMDNYTNASLAPVADVTINDNLTLEWTDTNANQSSQKYYALASFDDERMKVTTYAVGKYDILIHDETNIWQTGVGLPLDNNFPVSYIGNANDFAWVLEVDETKNDTWYYAYIFYGTWYGNIPGMEMLLGTGYYFDGFNTEKNLIDYGVVPTGNVTKTIYGEDNIKQTFIGWESINTNGSIPALIPTSNDFSWVLTPSDTQNDVWEYAYIFYGTWYGDIPNLEMHSGKAYYFDNFNTQKNLTYERNPY